MSRFTFVDNIFKYFETGIKDNQSAYEQLNGESVVDLLNNQEEEIMGLKFENTKLKLILKDIVADLEKESERGVPIIIQKEYADWIKSEVELEFVKARKND